jgi:hypothetical protein
MRTNFKKGRNAHSEKAPKNLSYIIRWLLKLLIDVALFTFYPLVSVLIDAAKSKKKGAPSTDNVSTKDRRNSKDIVSVQEKELKERRK